MAGHAGGLDRRGWLDLLGLAEDEVPQALVVEGSWWRREREAQRLALLTDVRELGAPDWWWGRYGGTPVVYACLYGGPRAVEPVDVLGLLGTPLVAQVGWPASGRATSWCPTGSPSPRAPRSPTVPGGWSRAAEQALVPLVLDALLDQSMPDSRPGGDPADAA